MKIIHFINALESGGAEKVMYETIVGLDEGFTHSVVTISKRGLYLNRLIERGVCVETLSLKLVIKLLFRSRKNTLVHSYLYRSHALSILFKLMGYFVIWSIHGSFPNNPSVLVKTVGYLSSFIPNNLIFVSKHCLDQHVQAGYCSRKSSIIHNGVDTKKFHDVKASLSMREDRSEFVKICMVSRFHAVKDYPRFCEIASFVIKQHPKTKFYLIGKGNSFENQALKNLLIKSSLYEHVILLGEVVNMAEVYSNVDLLVSTSRSESFGLTIMEAILSGVNASTINLPVMDELLREYSTNEGILENKQIAARWVKRAKDVPSQELKAFILENYSLRKMLDSYSLLYRRVVT